MYRTNLYLTDDQRSALAARAKAEGTSVAELVRKLVDRALSDGGEDVTHDLAVIESAFGVLAGTTVDVDRSDGARGAHLERVARR